MWLLIVSMSVQNKTMGYLLIDTRARDAASVLWWKEGKIDAWLENEQVMSVLHVIQERRAMFKDALEGVVVVAGPGRFSAIRVGVLTANILARWYRVPLFGVSYEEVATEDGLYRVFEEIVSHRRVGTSYVAPLYDREPNITTPRV